MREQGEASLEILNALLRWGQAQLNGISVHAVRFNPATTVENNIRILQGKAIEKQLTIQNLIPEDLKINADQDHFDFIIRNLISNAIKFSNDQGLITIQSRYAFDPDLIIFSVKDQGIGISEDQQKAFTSGNIDISFGTKGEKGTGIGLMLSKQFQTANGGKMWLDSNIGKGSTFYFSYPISKQDE